MREYFEDGIADNKLFEYSPLPALFLDSNGIVRAINVAFRGLFPEQCAGCFGNHYSRLEERFRQLGAVRLIPSRGFLFRGNLDTTPNTGTFCKESELGVATEDIEVLLLRLGKVAIRVAELPFVDPKTGKCIGSMISLDVSACNGNSSTRNEIDEALSHELLWEVYASSYDHILPELFFYSEAIDRHCAILADHQLRRIIDVGAGTGLQMQRLLQAGKFVTAVEISRAMLRRLKSRVHDEFHERCVVIGDSAEYLPQLKSQSFDAATILLAFFDMDNPWTALREVQRLIVPGGRIVLTEPRASFNVAELMQAGRDSLIAAGKMDRLCSDWERIETIAPLIRKRIANSQECSNGQRRDMLWNVENVYQSLKTEGYRDLAIVDSHLGNCATVYGTKPT